MTELFMASSDAPDDPDSNLPGTSIYEILKPRFSGDKGRVDAKDVELVESTLYSNLFLLRGDFELGMGETYFASAASQAITENVHEKQTYLVLDRLFHDLSASRSFDYALVDVGPSLGALTRMAVLSCDAFFIPTSPDRFCNQAMFVLGRVLNDWTKRHEEIISTFEAFGLEAFPGHPKLLGAVSQNFKAWAGKAKTSYQRWEERIANTLVTTFLSQENVEVSKGLENDPYVARIRDVGPLAPVAQIFGRAIFDIQQKHTTEASTTGAQYYGVVWANWVDRMKEYRKEIGKIAEALENG
jgi:cellulose biosynthesis protein BcsQ